MSDLIDEHAGWRLLRRVAEASGARQGQSSSADAPRAVRAHDEADANRWLEIGPGGSWNAWTDVTTAARELIDLFAPLAALPGYTIAQLGQSLDGRIATEGGGSHFVTGPEDLTRLHRLRALADAVIVGSNTVATDDPQLTVRRVEGENPVRVVVDPSGRLGTGHRVFTDRAAPTLWIRGDSASGEPSGYEEVVMSPSHAGLYDPHALLAVLQKRGLSRVLVEGGGLTVSRFLEAGALNRLHLTVAPMLIGSGRPSISLAPIDELDHALRPTVRRFLLGADVLFDLDLRATPR